MKALTLYLLFILAAISIAIPVMKNIQESPLGQELERIKLEKEYTLKELSQ